MVFKNTLIIYGTDFMSKNQVNKYFASFDICVEVYNSSNAKITFQNHEDALAALVSNLKEE